MASQTAKIGDQLEAAGEIKMDGERNGRRKNATAERK
jgi:hypothetical protein